ncbi:MAG: hypothetical protein L0I95_03840 [Tetragenococcus koreensis]|nr:hypothetical protein [Tetragenococcus koreensis]MCF1643408.1 hypothetical protein [Tetragenococcus koreensis]MCF1658283.1 hypothetical protein [Tetragenococcus koreensis]MCF1681128.1 hypothetical protein [Tetragenococcus koreensis]MDN5811004.1 hypothetical protein [Tetragenococcus koreensis]
MGLVIVLVDHWLDG